MSLLKSATEMKSLDEYYEEAIEKVFAIHEKKNELRAIKGYHRTANFSKRLDLNMQLIKEQTRAVEIDKLRNALEGI